MRDIWVRFQRRKELAKLGTAAVLNGLGVKRTPPPGRDDVNWEANACATLEQYGFKPSRDTPLYKYFPMPLGDIADDLLALPTKELLFLT